MSKFPINQNILLSFDHLSMCTRISKLFYFRRVFSSPRRFTNCTDVTFPLPNEMASSLMTNSTFVQQKKFPVSKPPSDCQNDAGDLSDSSLQVPLDDRARKSFIHGEKNVQIFSSMSRDKQNPSPSVR